MGHGVADHDATTEDNNDGVFAVQLRCGCYSHRTEHLRIRLQNRVASNGSHFDEVILFCCSVRENSIVKG